MVVLQVGVGRGGMRMGRYEFHGFFEVERIAELSCSLRRRGLEKETKKRTEVEQNARSSHRGGGADDDDDAVMEGTSKASECLEDC